MATGPTHHADSFFVLRTPSLPAEFLEAWSAPELCKPGGKHLAADREALKARLRRAVADPALREALFLASPDLEAALDPWLGGTLAPDKAARVERSLVRYLARMAFRCTPFGLFAGTSTGAWGGSRMDLQPWLASDRYTRMDMDTLAGLLASLEALPEVREALAYRPNTSLYRASGRLRYAEARGGTGRGREYHLVDLQPSPPLEAVLDQARNGAGFAFLAETLAREAEASLEEARAFLAELVEAQVLVGDLQPSLTGGDALGQVLSRLKARPATAALAEPLDSWPAALARLDQRGPGNPPSAYRNLAAKLDVFPVKVDLARLFQVDQHRPVRGLELPPRVRRCLEEAAGTLRRLTPPGEPGPLDAFRTAFLERYETRWVPLLEVLDAEAGIGFDGDPLPADAGLPLLDGMAFPGREGARPRPHTPRDAYLLRRLQGLGEARTWDLDEADLAALERQDPEPFPASFSALAGLAAASPEALAAGDFQVLMEQFAGPSGARLMARFCGGDPELEARVRAHLAEEEAARPEAVFAEVIHLPDGRTGNILARPALRAHEIPFLGVAGVPGPHQIQPSELRVGVVDGRVALWCPRLGREVVPRLSSAHNVSQGLAVYRFLARLQEQDGASAGWSWGALRDAAFLPRVVRGRHVLCRARWRIGREDFDRAAAEAGQDPWGTFALLRERRGLPRLVVLEDLDNTLPVDLDQALWVETLWHLVARRDSFVLTECFPAPDQLPARGPEGRFRHELVVPFLAPARPRPAPAGPLPVPAVRSFAPGSEWLYLKLYGGPAGADRLLLDGIGPLLEATRGLWDRWFFVRYADPRPHLRVRFHGHPERLCADLLPWANRLLEPLRRDGLAWKLQVDTYEQEVERYGGPEGMALAETWFWHDSEAVLKALQACQGDEGAEARWRLALGDIDRILAALGLDPSQRLRVVRAYGASLLEETGAAKRLEIQVGARFRGLAKDLDARLDAAPALEGPVAASLGSLARWARTAPLGVEALAPTLVHMHLNRLLRTEHRAQEAVLTGFLARLYAARLARIKA